MRQHRLSAETAQQPVLSLSRGALTLSRSSLKSMPMFTWSVPKGSFSSPAGRNSCSGAYGRLMRGAVPNCWHRGSSGTSRLNRCWRQNPGRGRTSGLRTRNITYSVCSSAAMAGRLYCWMIPVPFQRTVRLAFCSPLCLVSCSCFSSRFCCTKTNHWRRPGICSRLRMSGGGSSTRSRSP